jgi:hypothetical protein
MGRVIWPSSNFKRAAARPIMPKRRRGISHRSRAMLLSEKGAKRLWRWLNNPLMSSNVCCVDKSSTPVRFVLTWANIIWLVLTFVTTSDVCWYPQACSGYSNTHLIALHLILLWWNIHLVSSLQSVWMSSKTMLCMCQRYCQAPLKGKVIPLWTWYCHAT